MLTNNFLLLKSYKEYLVLASSVRYSAESQMTTFSAKILDFLPNFKSLPLLKTIGNPGSLLQKRIYFTVPISSVNLLWICYPILCTLSEKSLSLSLFLCYHTLHKIYYQVKIRHKGFITK